MAVRADFQEFAFDTQGYLDFLLQCPDAIIHEVVDADSPIGVLQRLIVRNDLRDADVND